MAEFLDWEIDPEWLAHIGDHVVDDGETIDALAPFEQSWPILASGSPTALRCQVAVLSDRALYLVEFRGLDRDYGEGRVAADPLELIYQWSTPLGAIGNVSTEEDRPGQWMGPHVTATRSAVRLTFDAGRTTYRWHDQHERVRTHRRRVALFDPTEAVDHLEQCRAFAAALQRAVAAAHQPAGSGAGVTECRRCGADVAPEMRRCPYCRTALGR